MARKQRKLAIIGVTIGVLGLIALLPLLAKSASSQHEIRLVARDMGFYVEGQTDKNPTIEVPAGAEVSIVLRNVDPGMIHDFVVQGLDVAMKPLANGAEGLVRFRAPGRPGDYEYNCTPHALMMYGTLRVE